MKQNLVSSLTAFLSSSLDNHKLQKANKTRILISQLNVGIIIRVSKENFAAGMISISFTIIRIHLESISWDSYDYLKHQLFHQYRNFWSFICFQMQIWIKEYPMYPIRICDIEARLLK